MTEPPPPVRLVVRNPISGESCDLGELRESLTVGCLKRKIKQHWKAPPLAQRLLLEGRVLDDSHVVCVPDVAKDVNIDMVLCLEPFLLALRTGYRPSDIIKRRFMLRMLAEWQPKGQRDIISAVFRRIAIDPRNRATALSVLPLVAERGDKLALEEAFRLLQKGGVGRLYGARALGLVVEKGDMDSFALLSGVLAADDDVDPDTFSAVLDAMSMVSPSKIAMLRALLRARRPEAQKSLIKLIRLLTEFAEKGCMESIAFLGAHCRHWCAEVQRASIESLGLLAHRSDWGTVNMVRPHLQSLDAGVRLAAVVALGNLAEEGDGGTIAGLSARLQDESEEVRSAADSALRRVATTLESGQEETTFSGCTKSSLGSSRLIEGDPAERQAASAQAGSVA